MVKKLMKYEFASYARTMLPMELILLGIAVLTRFIQLFENDTVIFDIINISSIVALVISMVVCIIMTEVLAITRFYKNLFTAEGYLSLTLPVTHAQHIFAKIFSAVIFMIISIISVVASFCIATVGEVLAEVFKAVFFIANKYFEYFGFHGALYIVEVLVGTAVVLASGMLLFYGCIAVGQLAKKNRVLAACGVYFGYYFVCQIIGTVLIILVTAFYEYLPIEAIELFITKHEFATIHIVICLMILFYAVLAVIYYLVTHAIMKKKLNIE